MAVTSHPVNIGWVAKDFTLMGIDGKTHSLSTLRGPKGLVLMFICNHCPYVKAIADRIARDGRALQALGYGVVAVNANDPALYPEDSFENMKRFAATQGFTFPYLIDDTQMMARAYDAVCTPEFYGFDAAMTLRYRGRLDASGREALATAKSELMDAMTMIAETGEGPAHQNPSMGCSIKWKQAA